MSEKFFQAYVTAALWSSTDDSGDGLDKNYSINDIAPECLERMKADCADFQKGNRGLLEQSGQSEERNGHDFWLTRNGHGAGWWDRGIGEIGDKLTEACKQFGTFDLYVGDDGKIYA